MVSLSNSHFLPNKLIETMVLDLCIYLDHLISISAWWLHLSNKFSVHTCHINKTVVYLLHRCENLIEYISRKFSILMSVNLCWVSACDFWPNHDVTAVANEASCNVILPRAKIHNGRSLYWASSIFITEKK